MIDSGWLIKSSCLQKVVKIVIWGSVSRPDQTPEPNSQDTWGSPTQQTQQLDIVTHNCLESAMNVSEENVLITSFVSLCVALQKQSHIK